MKIAEIQRRSQQWLETSCQESQLTKQRAAITRIQERSEEQGSFLDRAEDGEQDALDKFVEAEDQKWAGRGYGIHFRQDPDFHTAPRPRGGRKGAKRRIRTGF